ncbi:hypothetical protein V6Z12_D10G245100 [Gossypium hirsutum]
MLLQIHIGVKVEENGSCFREVQYESRGERGVVLQVGDLKGLILDGVLSDPVTSLVLKLTKKDWDLQLLPITSSKTSSDGAYPKSNEKKKLPINNNTTTNNNFDHQIPSTSEKLKVNSAPNTKKEATKDGGSGHIAAHTFTFRELAAATKNFRADCLLGEGGFGRVYKGRLESTNQVVAIKQLDPNGLQGNREFLVEVLMLSLLHHPNLVNLIGYCADGDQRLLVYEYMPLGSLEDHLHDLPPDRRRLDWNTRMKIAAGAAKGLEYLHDKASPPVIYRDLKCSNILLGEGYHPKLSDFGLAKLGPVGDKTHVSTRVMGTYGYCAPEYAMTGQLTLKSDVYSFGVVFLEIITGRKAIDNSRAGGEQNLVAWARPLFKDRRKFAQMADPLLQGQYPARGLYQALAVAAMCVQEQPNMRPLIADVVTALTYLASQRTESVGNRWSRFKTRTNRFICLRFTAERPQDGNHDASGIPTPFCHVLFSLHFCPNSFF